MPNNHTQGDFKAQIYHFKFPYQKWVKIHLSDRTNPLFQYYKHLSYQQLHTVVFLNRSNLEDNYDRCIMGNVKSLEKDFRTAIY